MQYTTALVCLLQHFSVLNEGDNAREVLIRTLKIKVTWLKDKILEKLCLSNFKPQVLEQYLNGPHVSCPSTTIDSPKLLGDVIEALTT